MFLRSKSPLPQPSPEGRAGRTATHLQFALLLVCSAAGCTTPSAANIQLRKENQTLQTQVDTLSRQHAADQAALAGQHNATVPTLPQDRLDQLFTTHGLSFGKLTGGYRADEADTGPADGIEVQIVPTDDSGDEIKAAGSFTVQVFDLADAAHPLLDTWNFSPQQTRTMFYDHLMLYTYVLHCPWQHGPPPHGELTLRVSFTDALTGRVFTAEKQVHVNV